MTWWKQWTRALRVWIRPHQMRWLEDLLQDARQGVRVLRKAPGFAAIAALTLALGIGATTAVYSVVHGLLLTPLPYPDSERVVYIYQTQSGEEGVGNVSIRNYFDIAERARSFTAVAATGGWFGAVTCSSSVTLDSSPWLSVTVRKTT